MEEKKLKEMDAKIRQVYNREENELDMRKKRSTDMRNNRRVFLPQARPPKEEAVLDARSEMWTKVMDEFMDWLTHLSPSAEAEPDHLTERLQTA